MTHLVIVAAFAAILLIAARSILADLTRPLVPVPADQPDWDFTFNCPGE